MLMMLREEREREREGLAGCPAAENQAMQVYIQKQGLSGSFLIENVLGGIRALT